MNRLHICACSWLALGAVALAQDVPCEKYRLNNGLTVILHEDHNLPVACINTWFFVGSKDEAPGRSGFAHLFEHLMFMGTRRVPGNQFDVLMEKAGGFNNASTAQDRTNYFSFGPPNLLPTLLWLDADRLEDLGNEMTQEKLDKQREVVRNERRQSYEMRPYGQAELKISELMYPPGHPYHLDAIGSHEDLQAATVRDVKDFFAAYYLPNNASLVVAGDFDPREIKPLVENLFGTLPRGPAPVRRHVEPVRLEDVRRVTYSDRVQFARTTFVYHSPAHFAAGDAELDLAADVLASGTSSRLYERLVYQDKLATEVSAQQDSQLLGSLFKIQITAREGVALDQLEKTTDQVLAEFMAQGPTENELQRHKARTEYRMISRLESLLQKADALNRYNFYYGEPNSFRRDLDRYLQATVASVREWSAKTLTPDARLIMRVVPEQKTSPRDQAPELAAPRPFAPPSPDAFQLSNGIEVRHWTRRNVPLVHVSLYLRAGAADDVADQSGLAKVTAAMLREGAGNLGALEFNDALQSVGARLTDSVDQESTRVNLSVLKRNLDRALPLYADAILRPRFDQQEWDRVRTIHLQDLKEAEDRAPQVATRVGLRAFFGEAHPYGRPIDGTAATISRLTPADLRRGHAQRFTPQRATIFIAGDLSAQEAQAALEKALGAWPGGAAPSARETSKPLPAPVNKQLRVVLVNKPQAVQTVIRWYMPGPTFASPDRIAFKCLNTILGGGFTSRLNQNLREDKGYTYGASSSFAMRPATGYLVATADVQVEHTAAALREFLAEFARLRTGDISPVEVEKTQTTNRLEKIRSFQDLALLIESAEQYEQSGLPFSVLGEDLTKINAVTQAELNALAKSAIPLEQALLVLVGDKHRIASQMASLQLPPVEELTVRGDPAPQQADR